MTKTAITGEFMSYYPILVDLHGEKVVVVGGGEVAQRKIESLLEHGAVVHVVSRELTPPLEMYREEGRIKYIAREFKEKDLQGAFLVIAATNDPILNRGVAEVAKKRGVLVNVVDQPSDCNFIVPAVIKRGDLLIAVSTSGRSPAMAKRIKERLSSQFGSEYEGFLRLMGRLRKEILSRNITQEEKGRIFNELIDSTILEAIARKDWDEVATDISRLLGMNLPRQEVIDCMKTE